VIPSDRLQRVLRRPVRALFHRHYDVHLHGAERVPAAGPVILAPNHVGWLDGPLLVCTAPRPVHAMVKQEEFVGHTGRFLTATGQIRLDRFHTDVPAVRQAVRLLQQGRVVCIYPEGARGQGDARYVKRGWAYLAMVTGAPIVPVATFGTRFTGESIHSRPPAGRRIDVFFAPPVLVDPVPWPRRAADVRELTAGLQQILATHIAESAKACGARIPHEAPDAEGPEPGAIAMAEHDGSDGGSPT